MPRVGLNAIAVSLFLVLLAAPAWAQATATEFYLEYRKAFESAASIGDVLPFLAAAVRKDIESTPTDERAQLFAFIRTLGVQKNLKIVREDAAPEGAVLTVEGLDGSGVMVGGTITLVREDGAFKLQQERWGPR